ncbi:hypothetical protein OH76DRAFT_1423907 [Lentinus brumalis]|uniref:RING-type domain-containing protein n=1 Tax=Lentinus brumalis TaxID=2498619 RepID=A0A371CIJ8_9APHY|nr:hypothetical protein OH76DRAFT_1423907 [Polyporus brumalis]
MENVDHTDKPIRRASPMTITTPTSPSPAALSPGRMDALSSSVREGSVHASCTRITEYADSSETSGNAASKEAVVPHNDNYIWSLEQRDRANAEHIDTLRGYMHRGAAELSAVKSDLDCARVCIVGLETCVSESNRSLKESRRVLEEQRRQLQQEREKARADRSELDRQRALFEQYTKAATQLNDQHLHVQRQLLKSETTLQNTLDALTAAKRDLQRVSAESADLERKLEVSNSSLASAQRELADIKTELACGICRGVRRVTHTYKCGHTYCHECTRDYEAFRDEAFRNSATRDDVAATRMTYRCPTCRSDIGGANAAAAPVPVLKNIDALFSWFDLS